MADTIDDADHFGRMIRRRRKALGLRQRDLALSVDVGERFIVDLEAGKPTCQLGKALSVARALGIRLIEGPEARPHADGGYDLPDPSGWRP